MPTSQRDAAVVYELARVKPAEQNKIPIIRAHQSICKTFANARNLTTGFLNSDSKFCINRPSLSYLSQCAAGERWVCATVVKYHYLELLHSFAFSIFAKIFAKINFWFFVENFAFQTKIQI